MAEKNTAMEKEIGNDPRGGSLLYAKDSGERRRGQTRKNRENKRGIARGTKEVTDGEGRNS